MFQTWKNLAKVAICREGVSQTCQSRSWWLCYKKGGQSCARAPLVSVWLEHYSTVHWTAPSRIAMFLHVYLQIPALYSTMPLFLSDLINVFLHDLVSLLTEIYSDFPVCFVLTRIMNSLKLYLHHLEEQCLWPIAWPAEIPSFWCQKRTFSEQRLDAASNDFVISRLKDKVDWFCATFFRYKTSKLVLTLSIEDFFARWHHL